MFNCVHIQGNAVLVKRVHVHIGTHYSTGSYSRVLGPELWDSLIGVGELPWHFMVRLRLAAAFKSITISLNLVLYITYTVHTLETVQHHICSAAVAATLFPYIEGCSSLLLKILL